MGHEEETFTTPDRTSTDMFCWRSVQSGQMANGVFDKYVVLIEANFVAGKAVIDLKEELRPGTRFDYIVMGHTRSHIGADATVDGKTLKQGQAVLDKANYNDASTGIVGQNIISDSVGTGRALVMIIFNPNNRA